MTAYTKKLISIVLSSALVAIVVTTGRIHHHLTAGGALLITFGAGAVLGILHAFIFNEPTDE